MTETPVQPTEQVTTSPDWDSVLETIPPEILRKNRRFQGIAGEYATRLAEQYRSKDREEVETEAVRRQEKEMMELAQANPFEFTQKWLGGKTEEIARREFSELAAKEQRRMLDALGEAYGTIPEWKELTQEEFGDVAQKTAGLSGAELIAAFNMAAFDKVAEKRASKRVQKEVAERLKLEREAWEREAQAARLRSETIPPLTASEGAARIDPWSLSDKDFNELYERTFLR